MRLLFRDAWVIKSGGRLYRPKGENVHMQSVLWHGRFFEQKGLAMAYLRARHEDLPHAKVVKVRLIVEQIE